VPERSRFCGVIGLVVLGVTRMRLPASAGGGAVVVSGLEGEGDRGILVMFRVGI
jgi:hypothetical protein